MTIVEGPKTLADFKEVRKTIENLMANPYCYGDMFESLDKKLRKLNDQIEQYKKSMLDCPDCGGDGAVVHTGAECCGNYREHGCCNNPTRVPVPLPCERCQGEGKIEKENQNIENETNKI